MINTMTKLKISQKLKNSENNGRRFYYHGTRQLGPSPLKNSANSTEFMNSNKIPPLWTHVVVRFRKFPREFQESASWRQRHYSYCCITLHLVEQVGALGVLLTSLLASLEASTTTGNLWQATQGRSECSASSLSNWHRPGLTCKQ